MASQTQQSPLKKGKSRSMDFRSIIKDTIKSIWIIAIAAFVAAAAVFMIVTESYSPRYESTITYVVTSTSAYKTVYSNITTANDLATAFSNVLNSAAMKNKVSEALGGNFDGEISAETVNETNLLNVTVTADDPETAFKAARAVITNHQIVTDEIMQNAMLQILDEPEVASSPANLMNRDFYVSRAAVVTAVLMLMLVIWMSYSRDTVKSVAEFGDNIDSRIFSTVYHERNYKTLKSFFKRRNRGLLITSAATSFSFVETIKKIRTRFEYAAAKKDIKTLMITSVLENEGKSTICVNLAIALAEKGKKVMIIDADLRRQALYKLFEYKDGGNDIEAVLTGKEQMTDAVHFHEESGVYILGGRRANSQEIELASSARMHDIIKATVPVMDYVIVDTPPMSVAADAEAISRYCDSTLLVVRQDSALVKDINDTIDVLRDSCKNFLGCIFNDASNETSGLTYGYGYGKYYNKYNKRYENARRQADTTEENTSSD